MVDETPEAVGPVDASALVNQVPAKPAQDISAEGMHKLFGRAVLFIFRTETWTPNTFAGAAKFARSLGFDSISPKRGEGTDRWYGTPQTLAAERRAVLSEGCGYAPFLYCDGPKFGMGFIPQECDVLKEMGDENDGIAIADMESEWDGNAAAASLFCEQMRPWPGVLGITTFADPAQNDWLNVAAQLAPCCNLWIPQRYDDWLNAQALPPEMTIIQPAVDLSSEFGANHVLNIVRGIAAKNETAWLWEYAFAQSQQAFVRSLTSILHGETLAELPGLSLELASESATPDTGYQYAYITGPNDVSLANIAGHLGLSNWYQELYKPNMTAIEAAAVAAGHAAGSSGGLVVVPGIKLNYNM